MVPSQKYDVIHYLREIYLKGDNPTQFVRIDRAYLDRLPKGTTRGPEPSSIEPWSAMDYGPALSATVEVGDDATNFAYKGVAIRLDVGPGDSITVTCTHDQSVRDLNPTFRSEKERYVVWGEGTTDEMCLGVVLFTRP